MATLLVVDDEKNYLLVLEVLLQEEGHDILTAANGWSALNILQEKAADLVITDLKMPRMDGIKLLREIKKINPYLPVILMTAYGTVETAVEAMKEGAFDYILKPFQNEDIKLTVAKALKMSALIKENESLKKQLKSKYKFKNIMGNSSSMQKVYQLMEQIAETKTTVLIKGESGTGKELVARAIHHDSPRSDKPFVSLNCAALAETILESELFGHEKGAFTGAMATRQGRLEAADGGSLFLDEIGNMPLSLQMKLLRFLQEREFERVGSASSIQVDVRIISATNANLRKLIKERKFREDLYYRLNVMSIELPPLRQRKDDIPLLAYYFLKKYSQEMKKEVKEISPSALKLLAGYRWPGNVRELENVMERAVLLTRGDAILPESLSQEIRELEKMDFNIDELVPFDAPLNEALSRTEEQMIRRAMQKTKGVQNQAAKILGITRSNLQYKLNKYGIQ